MTSNNYVYCKNGCGQLIKLGNVSLTGKKILLGENGILHNCPNRPAIDKQESELRKYPVTGQLHHCSEWPGKVNLETAK